VSFFYVFGITDSETTTTSVIFILFVFFCVVLGILVTIPDTLYTELSGEVEIKEEDENEAKGILCFCVSFTTMTRENKEDEMTQQQPDNQVLNYRERKRNQK
jgi:hypothetical protein